jgi:hypothetical protein
MPMSVNLTNIISLCIRDRLIKFEERSSMKSINVIHILNPIKYSMSRNVQIARFDFEDCDFHTLFYFIFLPYISRNVWMLAF